MAAKKDLIASSRSNEEIKAFLGCDNLVYQSLEDLVQSVLELNPSLNNVEKSIFDGVYPTDISESYLENLEIKRG
jgi:amidophosphoribosyltransferase